MPLSMIAPWNSPADFWLTRCHHHAEGASTLPKERHTVRVPAEVANVRLDPAQRQLLILESMVPCGSSGGLILQCIQGHEAQDTEAIIQSDHHDLVLPGQVLAIVKAHGVAVAD